MVKAISEGKDGLLRRIQVVRRRSTWDLAWKWHLSMQKRRTRAEPPKMKYDPRNYKVINGFFSLWSLWEPCGFLFVCLFSGIHISLGTGFKRIMKTSWTEFLLWQEGNVVCNLFYPLIPNYQWKFSLDHIFHTNTTTGTGEMEWSAENRLDTDRMDSQTHEET